MTKILKPLTSKPPVADPRHCLSVTPEEEKAFMTRQNLAMRRLVTAVQELSLARTLDAVMAVVRRAARELTGADGATFVLKDDDKCYYADEDAIEPLWKGQRFPLSMCISGWSMLNRQPAVIEDIYADARIPAQAYRPTFVKSLVMVPIRVESPIGAIGNYWARPHLATPAEVELLQTLANTTSVAMENVQLYNELEQRVHDRTVQLEALNQELESFSYSASHDLQAPLRRIAGFTELLEEHCKGTLDTQAADFFSRITKETKRMSVIINDLLKLSKLSRMELVYERVRISHLAQEIAASLQSSAPDRHVEFRIQDGLEVEGHPTLLCAALENLLSNAWKYSSKRENAVIEFGSTGQTDGAIEFFVRDNGVGFDMQFANKLFQPFQRLHAESDFAGTGIGLATVQRIIQRHGGAIRVEASPDKGATFFFTLPQRRLPAKA